MQNFHLQKFIQKSVHHILNILNWLFTVAIILSRISLLINNRLILLLQFSMVFVDFTFDEKEAYHRRKIHYTSDPTDI